MTGRERLRQIARRADLEGLAAFLPTPGDDEDVITTRAWLGWYELWRSEEALTDTIASIREDEHLLLARVLGAWPDDQRLSHLTAVIDGLRVAMSAPIRPMRPDQAPEILTALTPAPPAP